MPNPNEHNIVWTVLPNGTTGNGPNPSLKVSLFVSLRLASAGGGLNASFNWPQRVNALTGVQVEFQNDAGMTVGSPVSLNLDKSQLSLGGNSLWNQTFPGGSTVRAYPEEKIAELVARPKVTYPIKPIRETVHTLYGHVAEHFPTTPPPMFEGYADYPQRPGDYHDPNFPSLSRFLIDIARDIIEFSADPGGDIIIMTGGVGQLNGHPQLNQLEATSPFYRAYRFYRREIDNNRFPDNAVPPPTMKEPDVHEAIGMLGDHPFLLRRYGLIIDATFGSIPMGATRIRLVASALPTSDPAGVTISNRTPWTVFTRESGVFLPAPKADSDQRLGFLKLGDIERYEFQQLDVDGAALGLGNYASTLLDSTENFPAVDENDDPVGQNFPLHTPEDQRLELPNIRTAGFTVGRVARSDVMDTQFARSEELNSGASDVLFAEDVTRGFRFDVLDESRQNPAWRSLVRRRGAFFVGENRTRVPNSGNIQDEGYVKGSAATSEPGPDQTTADAPLYVHESLARWDGWSLIIKPPGRAQVFEEGTGDQVTRVENTPETEFKVEPQFQVDPGTLPKLRFGHPYRLRARTVDLAGNSLPLAATNAETVLTTEQQVFKRYEPVAQPVLVLRNKIVEGESVEHIVIRSKSGNAHLPGNLFFNRNERHVAPPQTTVEMIIRHGMLDDFFDDPTRSFNIAQKSEGTFLDPEIWDTRTGRKRPVPGIEIVNPPLPEGEEDNRPPPEFPARGEGLEPGQYVIHKNPNLLLPYLPDPLAVGVAVIDAPEVPRDPSTDPVLEDPRPLIGLQKIFFRDHWPNVEPFRIIVQSTNADEPSARVEGGDLVIKLPPATMLPLRFSSLLKRDALLEQMAIWSLMTPEAQANADLRQIAVDGQHWMITPNRDLMAVHAVERPLRAARFAPDTLVVDPPRKIGETFVRLAAVVDNHSRSTGRIDIEATWTDPVDRLTEPEPTEETNEGHVSNHQPEYGDSMMNVPLLPTDPEEDIPKQDFSDTKHRYVKYRPDATTRYREYFPPSVAADPNNIRIRGRETTVNVLSSARPNIPLVLYIVPTFKWETNRHTRTSKRIGRGLRVYLSRSWFSSGIDELLGVVLPILESDGGLRNPGPTSVTEATEDEDNPDPNLERVRRYISQWGDDPIWTGTGPSQHLVPANFANPVATNDVELNIAEDEAFPFSATDDTRVKVNVAAFPVEYNRDRQVWFADIEMQPADSYFPFVRLALARYQPHSVTQTEPNFFTTNVHLSRVIRTEFAQLVNDRSATVTPNMDTLTVTVVGLAARNKLGEDIVAAMMPPMDPAPVGPPGYDYDPAAGAGRVVTVQVERRTQGEGDSDFDWEAVGDPVLLPSFSQSGPMASPETLWTGQVPRPSAQQRRRFEYRLVIREIEVFDSDQDVAETVPIAIPPERESPRGPEPRYARGRVVYLDTIGIEDAERHGHGHR